MIPKRSVLYLGIVLLSLLTIIATHSGNEPDSVLAVSMDAEKVDIAGMGKYWAIDYGAGYPMSGDLTSDGGLVTAGWRPDVYGGYDAVVTRFDSTGAVSWYRAFVGDRWDTAKSIDQTDDGGFIVAGYSSPYTHVVSDYWVAKIDSTGEVEWQYTYGGNDYEVANAVQQTADGGYIVAGYTDSFGVGESDIWVLKLASNGMIEWAKAYGYGPGQRDWATSIRQTDDGDYIVGGWTGTPAQNNTAALLIRLDGDGEIEWQKMYSTTGVRSVVIESIDLASDGFVAAGYGYGDGFDGINPLVLKLQETGEVEWQRRISGETTEYALSVQQTLEGGYVIAGYGGPEVGWISKITSTGEIDWYKTHSESGRFYSILETSDGDLVATGYPSILVKTDENGEVPTCSAIEDGNATSLESTLTTEESELITSETPVVPMDSPVPTEDSLLEVEVICDGTGGTSYTISGRVTDNAGFPLVGAEISFGLGSQFTNDNGDFVISDLLPGTYTLDPFHIDYEFLPVTRTVTIGPDALGQDFTAIACLPEEGVQGTRGDFCPFGIPPLLEPPIDYDYTTFAIALAGNINGTRAVGRVNSWLDHEYPNYGENDRVRIWTGQLYTSTVGPLDAVSCATGIWCYDGHSGIDFSSRVAGVGEFIYASAPGTVFNVVDDWPNCDSDTNPLCSNGLGNQVWIDHGYGYASIYGHLEQVFVVDGNVLHEFNYRWQSLGMMGNTGNSGGIHLHFEVRLDPQEEWDEPHLTIDPYGCWPSSSSHPNCWGSSLYLWKYPLLLQQSVDETGGMMISRTGLVRINIPDGAVSVPTDLQLLEIPPAAQLTETFRLGGPSFWLTTVLDNDNPDPGATNTLGQLLFDEPLLLQASYDLTTTRHLDVSQLSLHHLDENTNMWIPMPSTVNPAANLVEAETLEDGKFSLQGPLICPTDAAEPDDNYYVAHPLMSDGIPLESLFDVEQDEDWYALHTEVDSTYEIQTLTLATDVDTIIRIYDADGVTLLASDDNSGSGLSSHLRWSAPASDRFYLRVTQAPGSAFGCDANYEIVVTEQFMALLPIILTRP